MQFFLKNYRKEIHIVTTNKCFFSCPHCCVGQGNESISLETIREIVNFAKKNGYNLNWGGGEILTLGKGFLETIVREFDGSFVNTLYSTLHINFDDEYIEMLEKFDRVMISIDSYRLKNKLYDIELVFNNAKKLKRPEKIVSYTPRYEDSHKDYETYYKMAQSIDACIFHVGFLYPSSRNNNILPAEKYIEIIETFYELEQKYHSPGIAFFSPHSVKPTENFGFRAYDCFKNGVYISARGEVASCATGEFAPAKIKVPKTSINSFLSNPEKFFEQNVNFMIENFFKNLHVDCKCCEYYPFCMGGCPYFRSFSSNGKDIYCEVYKKIFKFYLEKFWLGNI